ncbi:MMPL family transporter [Cohnella hongkongensis]|uniref:MMPL family transporter n=1 Tax=Cohnella hongkongensis TaxID=178337 RepID=A0ABV9F9C2_9BACL
MTFRRLADFTIRHRRRVIGFWLALAACLAPFAAQLPQVLGDHGLETDGPYAEVRGLLSRELGVPEEPVIVLFRNAGGLPEDDFRTSIAGMLDRIGRIGGAFVAASPLERPEMRNGEYAFAAVDLLPGRAEDKRLALERIREQASIGGSGIEAALTGKPVVQQDVNRLSRTDMRAAETIGLPAAFALLAAALGGLLPAIVPIAAGGITVIVSMGILYGIGAYGGLSLSVFVHNVVPMAGMAVCIDFALLMAGRFREERRSSCAREALRKTTATSGRAVAVSAGCVVLALIGAFFIRMPLFHTVALGALVVLAVSLLVNLTFVPAMLYALRRRLPAPKAALRATRRDTFGQALSNAVMKRPLLAASLASVALIVCMSPLRSLEVGVPGPESLPQSRESRLAAETLAQHFNPGPASRVWIAVSPENRSGAGRIAYDLERDPQVILAEPLESRLGEEGHRWFSVWLRGEEASKEAISWVRDREREYKGLEVKIGGEPKYHQEVRDEVFGRLKFVLLFAVLSNLIVLAAAFRSLLIPVKAVAMNLASIAASYGLLAWLFQEGRFGLEATDIAIMVPVFIFGLTFGISMDYGVFLLSRMYESYLKTRDNERAIREGMAASRSLIAPAAAIMIAVTAPFALAGVSGVKQLGIGIAAAIFLDATVVRMVLVPAWMKGFGKWNWWMPFARN